MKHPERVVITGAKAAVIMLSRCLRADWAGSGVGVSVVCHGVIFVVAKAIVSAAARNRSLVSVGIEATVAYHGLRALPLPVSNALARV